MGARIAWIVGLGVLGASSLGQVKGAGPTVVAKTMDAADRATLTAQYVARAQAAATRVRHMLDEARREKDVVKTICLSDKLAQVQTASRMMKQREDALAQANARGDVDVANHEFSVVSVLRQRSEALESEAQQCIGEPYIVDPANRGRIMIVDPNIAPVDPGFSAIDPVIIVPPLPVSGFK